MTIKITRFAINRKGVRELLKSPGVKVMLKAKGEAVASAARTAAPPVDGEPGDAKPPVFADVGEGKTRARVRIVVNHPSGVALEAKHALLAGAIDAAKPI